MVSILSLILVVTVSILVTRVATVALVHTGLSREAARFQARSAFTGAGFTTNESESVVNHPLRRRIVLLLMLLGNAGIVTAVSSLILTFVNGSQASNDLLKVALILAGVLALWAISSSQLVDRHLSRLIDKVLSAHTEIDVKDYSGLLRLAGEYRVAELYVREEDWLAGKTLAETNLRDEGIVVLGIKRPNDTYLGAPKPQARIKPGDLLITYGRVSSLEQLDQRRRDWAGDWQHANAVAKQDKVADEEEARDEVGARS